MYQHIVPLVVVQTVGSIDSFDELLLILNYVKGAITLNEAEKVGEIG